MQFFNFTTKIPLRPRKTAIAQPLPPNGHWPFCVMKVGMDVDRNPVFQQLLIVVMIVEVAVKNNDLIKVS